MFSFGVKTSAQPKARPYRQLEASQIPAGIPADLLDFPTIHVAHKINSTPKYGALVFRRVENSASTEGEGSDAKNTESLQGPFAPPMFLPIGHFEKSIDGFNGGYCEIFGLHDNEIRAIFEAISELNFMAALRNADLSGTDTSEPKANWILAFPAFCDTAKKDLMVFVVNQAARGSI